MVLTFDENGKRKFPAGNEVRGSRLPVESRTFAVASTRATYHGTYHTCAGVGVHTDKHHEFSTYSDF
jgi:hypothetical protein